MSGTERTQPLAVFACLPPTDSAIGKYTFASLISSPRPIHFFASYATFGDWKEGQRLIAENPSHRLYHSESFAEAYARESYRNAVFVLGNSFHHHAVLLSLMSYPKLFPLRAHVHIHEAQLTYALLSAFSGNEDALLGFFRVCYPEKRSVLKDLRSVFENEVYGIRALSALARPSTIIANSASGAAFVEREVAALVERPRIASAFLPIRNPVKVPTGPGPALRRIGTFGIPHPVKHLDVLVHACRILVQRGHPIELIVAGPGVTGYLVYHGLKEEFVRPVDSPTDEAMRQLQDSVDIGVQLRWPTHGESSASVNELLELGRKVVLTDTGSFSDLRDFALLTPVGVTAEQLADTLESAARFNPDFAEYARRFSVDSFQRRLFDIIESIPG